ncbi:hypothetical protein QJQ45_024358 [Haematococcus lacustris]|nr:hypothetical protein QJQ45_024358 [Haematococcus lacustris]
MGSCIEKRNSNITFILAECLDCCNARRDTERWLAFIKPHLQHLAAASSAGTSLEANLKHITVTLATWDAVWEVYLDPKWARQRLRLYGGQDRALEQFFKKVSVGVREGGPRGTDQQRGRVVLVDEHCTTLVSSAVTGQQPGGEELSKLSATRPAGWKPPARQVEHRLLHPAWSQQRDQPVWGLMWCPVVAPRKPPQAPCSSQAAIQPAASEPGPSTPPPAKRNKRTKTEQAAEPTQPTKGKGKAHDGCQSQASATARQVARQGLQGRAGTTPELAEPAGAPPQQQQQLAAASTSRKQGAPAANKSRAAKQGATHNSVAKRASAARLACGEIA